MNEEILNTVHSMFGKNVNIVDCQTNSSIVQEEVLLINGVEIKINGDTTNEADAIKNALLEGQIPSVELLNQLLYQAGLSQQPIELETALSVQSSLKTIEDVKVSKKGQILNEKSTETKEDYIYKSQESQILQPLIHKTSTLLAAAAGKANKKLQNDKNFLKNSSSSSSASSPSKHNNSLNKSSTVTITSSAGSHLPQKVSSSDLETSNSCSTFGASSSTINKCRSDLSSNISNCSTYTFSNPTLNSSSSTTVSSSTVSCDSGHDGLYHSTSQSVPISDKKLPQKLYNNSLSSCCDIVSSNDDIHQIKKDFQGNGVSDRSAVNKAKLGYKYPQTSAEIITDEPLNENLALTYSNNKLIGAPLDALILNLVPTNNYYPNDEFEFTFLLCARLFLPTHDLLAKIKQIWERQNACISMDDIDSSRKIDSNPKIKSVSNILKLLKKWIETFPYDFRNEKLMQEVRELTKKCIEISPNESKNVSQMLQNLIEKLTRLVIFEEQQRHKTQNISSASAPSNHSESQALNQDQQQNQPLLATAITSSSSSLSSGSMPNNKNEKRLKDVVGNPKELAHQLTIIELEMLSQIGLQEFFDIMDKEAKPPVSPKQITSNKTLRLSQCLNNKMSANLEAYVQWFNHLCYLTASEILKFQKKKYRVQMVEYWIEAARECFNIGNFNSLMAILAGLNMVPITRLKKTWSKVKSEQFSVLEHQMDPTSNFNSYRSTMKAAVWRSESARSAEKERIIIPFFTLFLKDLYFLNESCSNRLPNNHVNFEKCSSLAKQLSDYAHWTKQANCPYTKLPDVIRHLQNASVFNEEALQIASFACEPPDNADEKIHYKTLKK